MCRTFWPSWCGLLRRIESFVHLHFRVCSAVVRIQRDAHGRRVSHMVLSRVLFLLLRILRLGVFFDLAHVLLLFPEAANFFGRRLGAKVMQVTVVFIGPGGAKCE